MRVIADGNRENVTIIECICADGTSILPLYIFKGKCLQQSWIESDPLNTNYAASSNGWTDNEIGLEWLEKVFDAQTRHKSPGRKRLLILDGHASHLSCKFIQYARPRDIILLCFPAHSTAMLQALDIVLFAILSKCWTDVLEKELIGGLFMWKQDFCR